jgi:hypothetical protein
MLRFEAGGSGALSEKKLAGFERAHLLAPLVIGVTGHRDLREEDRIHLAAKVKEILLDLRRDYPATPLIVMSALAEGADRLVAEVALAPDVGARVVAPLPLPLAMYEQDFESITVLETPLVTVAVSRSSREEFRELLARTDWFELDLAPGNSYEAIAEPGPERNRQYELVGRYIAKQSQILIALWDGAESDAMGGTAEVVGFQTEGVSDSDACELEAPDGFPAYQIVTPRLKNPFPHAGPAMSVKKIYPKAFEKNEEQAEKYYRSMFNRLNEFNQYIAEAGDKLASEMVRSKKYLLQDLREDQLPPAMQAVLNRYAIADALAIRYQRHWIVVQAILHGLIFTAFFCFLLCSGLPAHWPRFLAASGILAGIAIVMKLLSGKWGTDTEHEDYRAMAEGLRVKFFWKAAGIKGSVADHYFGKQRSELDWIRNGFRGWNVAEGGQNQETTEALDEEVERDRLALVRKYWIDDQQKYFERAAERDLASHERLERTGLVFIAGVGLLFLILLVSRLHGAEYPEGISIGLETLLAAAAILHHYDNRMAYAEHAKQYRRVAALFAHGSELLGRFLERRDYENAAICVKQIGDEALTENGDWVLLHRERPLEMPHP